jgi:hypothetical protein
MFSEFELERIKERILWNNTGSCMPDWVFEWMQSTIKFFPAGSKIVELGTFIGGTTRLLALANKDKEVHSIDLNIFNETFCNTKILDFIGTRFDLQNLTPEKVLILQKLHVEDLPNVKLYTGESTTIDVDDIAVAFIDDNKDEEGMLENLAYLWPRMIDGGVIFADDIDSPQIYNAYVKFAKKQNIEITFYSKAVKLVKKDTSGQIRDLSFQDTLVFKCPRTYNIDKTTVTRY